MKAATMLAITAVVEAAGNARLAQAAFEHYEELREAERADVPVGDAGAGQPERESAPALG